MAEEQATHRIAKLLARAGVASRRDIERMIEDGRVALHGVVLDTPATLLATLDGVTVDGEAVAEPELTRLFLFHKPAGYLTAARDPMGRPTIYDRLPADLPRLMPVGRLDLNTEGLLLLTTDGAFKRQLELPSTGVERAYRARAYGDVTQAQLEELIDGVEIDGIRYGSIDANLERRTGANVWIEMILTEGKNREVRRVLEYLGLQVSRLIRTRYGPFVMGDLPIGEIGEVRGTDLVAFRNSLKDDTRLAPERSGTITATAIDRGSKPRAAPAAHGRSDHANKPSSADGYDPIRTPHRTGERVPTRGAFGRPAREFAPHDVSDRRAVPFGRDRLSSPRPAEGDRFAHQASPFGGQRRLRPSQGTNEPDSARSRRPAATPRPAPAKPAAPADERTRFREDRGMRPNRGGDRGSDRASSRNRSSAIDPTHEARPFRDQTRPSKQSRSTRDEPMPRDRIDHDATGGGRSQRPGRPVPDARATKSTTSRTTDRDEATNAPRSPRPERKPGWARPKPKPGARPGKPRK